MKLDLNREIRGRNSDSPYYYVGRKRNGNHLFEDNAGVLQSHDPSEVDYNFYNPPVRTEKWANVYSDGISSGWLRSRYEANDTAHGCTRTRIALLRCVFEDGVCVERHLEDI